ncbi:MAG: pyridoxal-phosphate dependent enzyme [Actinomycetia bacterium]|nr:pyridoxal-phosphate dependent enzyme [Actinomycetes bacterium]MCP4223099.1 pyridoxal-phosphate dependent enzyme [Actinomycetes bacterium]
MLTLGDVIAAAARLEAQVNKTPVLVDHGLNMLVGADVRLKAECLQETGSFKFRGASNAIAQLSADELAAGVVTYSSGNHGQAVARAASLAGTTAVVVMPHDAPLQKAAMTQAEGAEIVRYDRYGEDRVEIAEEIAKAEGRALIPPFDDYGVMAGQGTAALELLDQVDSLDALFVPVGGGGLLAGCATVMRDRCPQAEIYGVEPEAGDDHRRSRRRGERVEIPVPVTIADGQQISTPGRLTWPINERLTSQFLTVTDPEITITMRLLFERLNIVVEPSGASALAALIHRDLSLKGKRIGVILSGGNVGWPRFQDLTA